MRIVTALGLLAAAASWCLADGPVPTRPRAAVLDFTEPAAQTGRLIGRRAAEAVHAALAADSRWDLIDRAYVVQACQREGLEPPFAVGHLEMLGDQLRAPLVVTGLVQVCEVNAARRVAQVTLVGELDETLGGNSLASVRGVASAKARPGEVVTLDQVLDRALTEAAADLVRALTNFDPTAALVVATLPDGRVILDAPEKPDLRPGDALLVLSDATGSRATAVLRVQSVTLTVVHAEVVAGEGLRQGQRPVLVAR